MNLDKIHELNELSSDVEHNLPRMKELAHEIVEALNMPQVKKEPEWYEFDYLKICDKGIQRQSCRWCVWETYCNLEKNNMVG